jgi:hypothetical protein
MTTQIQTVTLDIHESRHAEATKMLAKLMKKATRYGMDLAPEWTGLWQERVKKGENIYAEAIWEIRSLRSLTISTPLLRAGDYELVAKVEGTPNGNFVDTVPGVEFDDGDLLQFRTADSYCDHCKTARKRKHVFVVRDVNTGNLVQVGRSCLQDFLGINVTWALSRFTWLQEWVLGDEDDMRGWSTPRVELFDLAEIIRVGVQSSRIFGWCSKGMAAIDESKTPTVADFWLLIARVRREKLGSRDLARLARLDEDQRDSDAEEAAKIIAWVRGLDNPGNEYLHNLTVAMAEDTLADRWRIGLVISAVSAYARAHEADLNTQDKTPAWVAQKELDAKSTHQGELKERLRDIPVTVRMVRCMGQSDFNWEAINYLVKFQDADGNIFTWFTSTENDLNYAEDQEVTLTGTVKGHNDYNGVKETQLNRCCVTVAA